MSAPMMGRAVEAPARTRPANPERSRPLKVAPEIARRRLRTRLLLWGSGRVTVASLFTLVGFHVLAAQSAFTLQKLEKQRTNEQLRYERLRLQVAESSSAESVRASARAIGMIDAPNIVPLVAPAASSGSTTPESVP